MVRYMSLQKNEMVELEILDVTNEGNGVGRIDGLAVFVPMSAVGDKLIVRITKVLKNYAYGIIDEVVLPSADRIESDCPVFRRCGGCAYRHISYEAELRIKQRQVYETLARIGGVRFDEQRILPSPQADHYRNKAQYPVRPDENG
ncbi:MAG: TRAM domain-containing protein, partial [Acetanaerobacterium sp.]